MGIQTRTSFQRSSRQVMMPHYLRFRKQFMQLIQQFDNTFSLCLGASIAWLAMHIQTTLVTDAYRTAVVRSAMRPHLQQLAMLRNGSILTNIKMVADGTKATLLMIAHQLFNTIILIASGSRTMQDQKSNTLGRLHQLAVLHLGKEGALVAHSLPTNGHRISFQHHSSSYWD